MADILSSAQNAFRIRTHGPNAHSALLTYEQVTAIFALLRTEPRTAEQPWLRMPKDQAVQVIRDQNVSRDAMQAIHEGNFHIQSVRDPSVCTDGQVTTAWELDWFWDLTQSKGDLEESGLAPEHLTLIAANKFYIMGPPPPKPHELKDKIDFGLPEQENTLLTSEAMWLFRQKCEAVFVMDYVWWRTGKRLAFHMAAGLQVTQMFRETRWEAHLEALAEEAREGNEIWRRGAGAGGRVVIDDPLSPVEREQERVLQGQERERVEEWMGNTAEGVNVQPETRQDSIPGNFWREKYGEDAGMPGGFYTRFDVWLQTVGSDIAKIKTRMGEGWAGLLRAVEEVEVEYEDMHEVEEGVPGPSGEVVEGGSSSSEDGRAGGSDESDTLVGSWDGHDRVLG